MTTSTMLKSNVEYRTMTRVMAKIIIKTMITTKY